LSLAFKELRVYFRVLIAVIVVGAVLVLLFMNRGPAHAVPVWFFGLTQSQKPVNVITIILCSAAGTLVSWWLLSLCWGLWRELRELKHERLLHDTAKDLRQRSKAMDERERRIDEKIEQVIRQEEPEPVDSD